MVRGARTPKFGGAMTPSNAAMTPAPEPNPGFANSGFGNSGFGQSSGGFGQSSGGFGQSSGGFGQQSSGGGGFGNQEFSSGGNSGRNSRFDQPSDGNRSRNQSGNSGRNPSASPFQPTSAPASIPEQFIRSGEWISNSSWSSVDQCVAVRPSYNDEELPQSREGAIRGIQNGRATVYFDELSTVYAIGFEHLMPVKPREDGDEARIIYGDRMGEKGTAVSIASDNNEAAFRSSTSGNITMVPLALLCKIH